METATFPLGYIFYQEPTVITRTDGSLTESSYQMLTVLCTLFGASAFQLKLIDKGCSHNGPCMKYCNDS